jgi:hypothetical protein
VKRCLFNVLAVVSLLLLPVPGRAAEKPELWLYYPTNLQVNANIDTLQRVWTRAAAAGYTHVLLADSKFARLGDLGEMQQVYFANVSRTRRIATDLKLQIVPALFSVGYSNNLLYHDPNLAEGLPVKDALFVVHNGQADMVADPPVRLGQPTWKDDAFVISDGVATTRGNPANSRMVWELPVAPFRCYHLSLMVRSDHCSGRPELKAIADGRELQYESLPFHSTQIWTHCDVVFNSLNHKKVGVYFGIWGGFTGLLACKDWTIGEAALTNVLRRPGAPCVVRADGGGVTYVEGRDYTRIVDPKLGNEPWPGEYEAWHESPPIFTDLAEGTRLRVSWFHPAIIYDEQVCMCLCEPKARQILSDQATRMKQAWQSEGYMMSHDEIRVMNWDESCETSGQTPGQILADNVRFCTNLLTGSTVYVWSDMFDPFHNAHDNYYLVNGDLGGSWDGLAKDVVIVNWNFQKRDQSLKFFADRGHHQIIAGYYDADVSQIKSWLESANRVSGIVGVMYTTWRGDYSNLDAFAKLVEQPPATVTGH